MTPLGDTVGFVHRQQGTVDAIQEALEPTEHEALRRDVHQLVAPGGDRLGRTDDIGDQHRPVIGNRHIILEIDDAIKIGEARQLGVEILRVPFSHCATVLPQSQMGEGTA